MDRSTELVVAALGGALVGALTVHVIEHAKKKAAAAATNGGGPPALGTGVSTLAGGGVVIALTSSNLTQSLALDVNTAVIVQLPAGASWISVDGSPINDTTSPYGFVFLGGPITHTFVWVDSTKAQWTATFNLTVAQTVPTTSA